MLKQQVHIGDRKDTVVDAVNAQQRCAGFVENALIEQREPRRVLYPLFARSSAEGAGQGLGQFERIFAPLGFDDPVSLKREMSGPALIDGGFESMGMSMGDFGSPVPAGAAADDTDAVGVQVRAAGDEIEDSIPQTLSVLGPGERRVRYPGHIDA